MKEEKLNNSLRQKLDGFSSIPEDYNFQQQKVWEQLEAAMQPAKPKRKLIWLSWAAIFLIIIGGYFLFTVTKKEKLLTPNTAQNNIDNHEKSVSLSVSENKTTASIIPAIAIQQKNDYPICKDEKASITQTLQKNTIADTASIAASIPLAKETIETVLKAVVVSQSPTVIAPVVQAKKPRLKVIHINELYQTDEQPMLLTKAERKKIEAEQVEEDALPVESVKSWWLPKQKSTNTTLTDHQ